MLQTCESWVLLLLFSSSSDQMHAEKLVLEASEWHGVTVQMHRGGACCCSAWINKPGATRGSALPGLCLAFWLTHTEIFTACTTFPYWYLVAEDFGISCKLKTAFSSVYLDSALPAWVFKLSTSQWESQKHLTLQGTKFYLLVYWSYWNCFCNAENLFSLLPKIINELKSWPSMLKPCFARAYSPVSHFLDSVP